jgi:F0F1-type ATP synthase delta subunit
VKYTPQDYAQILYKTQDVNALMKLLEKHWVASWLPGILENFEELRKKNERVASVTVRSAYQLSEDAKKHITRLIQSEQTERAVEIDFIIDKLVIAGFRIESDELLLPACLSDRIEELQANLE